MEFLSEAVEFMDGLDQKSQEKIYFNIRKAQLANDPDLFKKLTDNIWEFRTLYNKTHYRIFAFWHKTHGPSCRQALPGLPVPCPGVCINYKSVKNQIRKNSE